MNTVGRLYFYFVSAVALEVTIWGGVSLLRLLADPAPGGESLAGGLSAVLVGALVFALHWRAAQMRAQTEAEERDSWERAFFLYAMLAFTLIPCVQALLQVVGRGRGDLWALPFNLLAAYYLFNVLRADWAQGGGESRRSVRRWARYFWMLYGLMLLSVGLKGLFFILSDLIFGYSPASLRQPAALTAFGLAIWGGLTWRVLLPWIDKEPQERGRPLRQGIFFVLEVGPGLTLITLCASLLYSSLSWALGESTRQEWLTSMHGLLPVLMLGLLLWGYHRQVRRLDEAQLPPERTAWARALRRYVYLTTGFGLLLAGGLRAVSWLAQALAGEMVDGGQVSGALTLLAVGAALWLPLQKPEAEAARLPFRRVRRIYFYLYILAGTLGLMVTALGWLRDLFSLLFAGYVWAYTWPSLLRGLFQAALFSLTLRYFLGQVNAEKRAQAEVEKPQVVRVFLAEGAEDALPFLAAAAEIQSVDDPSAADVLLLSADRLESAPPEADALRLVLPAAPRAGWFWLMSGTRQQALETLPAALRAAARGETPELRPRPVWLIVLYVLAGLFVLQWVFVGLALLLEVLM